MYSELVSGVNGLSSVSAKYASFVANIDLLVFLEFVTCSIFTLPFMFNLKDLCLHF